MKFAHKSDLLIVGALLLAGAAIWMVYRLTLAQKPARAELYYGSTLVETVELNTGEVREFSLPQNSHVLFRLEADGSIRFAASDCPDQICVRAGRLAHPGESAACLPNKIILKLVPADGRAPDGLDTIAG